MRLIFEYSDHAQLNVLLEAIDLDASLVLPKFNVKVLNDGRKI